MEKANNKHLKDKVADLEQKLDFNRQLHNEQLKDANGIFFFSSAVFGKKGQLINVALRLRCCSSSTYRCGSPSTSLSASMLLIAVAVVVVIDIVVVICLLSLLSSSSSSSASVFVVICISNRRLHQ